MTGLRQYMDANLETAVKFLDAEKVPNGYRYFDHATAAYWVSSETDATELGRRIIAGDKDAYSVWCSDTDSEEVPTDLGDDVDREQEWDEAIKELDEAQAEF